MKEKRYFIVKNAMIREKKIFLEGQVWFQQQILFESKPGEKKIKHVERIRKHYRKTPLISEQIHVAIGKMEYTITLDKLGSFDTILPFVGSENNIPSISFHFHHDGISTLIEDLFPATVWNYSKFEFGLISDVDDTIVISHAFRILKKLWHLLFKNAYNRKPIDPVRFFYQDLEKEGGAFFYVSNSEYNLYFLYREFLRHRGFPSGPLFLSPRLQSHHLFGIEHKGRKTHKIHTISQILKYFPDRRFFLVGDSGQKDSKIYYHIVQHFPERIAGVIIRDVGKKSRHKYVKKYQRLAYNSRVPFFHIKHKEELTSILNDLHELIRTPSASNSILDKLLQ